MEKEELEADLLEHRNNAANMERALAIGVEVPALQCVVKLLIAENLRLSESISCMCYNYDREIAAVRRIACNR